MTQLYAILGDVPPISTKREDESTQQYMRRHVAHGKAFHAELQAKLVPHFPEVALCDPGHHSLVFPMTPERAQELKDYLKEHHPDASMPENDPLDVCKDP